MNEDIWVTRNETLRKSFHAITRSLVGHCSFCENNTTLPIGYSDSFFSLWRLVSQAQWLFPFKLPINPLLLKKQHQDWREDCNFRWPLIQNAERLRPFGRSFGRVVWGWTFSLSLRSLALWFARSLTRSLSRSSVHRSVRRFFPSTATTTHGRIVRM